MKKLFSYLLISSMVVLSSCTNYDDQFDDLNAQINTLKSQIEGFSSLSTGLTALQGTVASLQAAINSIDIPAATDISGLEASLATLSTTVEALQASLANAATAAEVAALQTALTAAQADLTELLSQNNIYAPVGGILNVKSQADLDFATNLGDKVTIINGGVHIDQTTTMDPTQLSTLLGKFVSVTGTVTYTATQTSTTTGQFAKLNGAANLHISVASGNISLPDFKSTGSLSLTGGDTTLSVSLPSFTHSTSGLGAFSFPKATLVDLSALTAYDGAIVITTADNATVDLTSFTNLTKVDGTAATAFEGLTVNNATILKAPVFAKGEILASHVASVDLPKWQSLSASSRFNRAETVVLPAVDPGKVAGADISIQTVFPKASSVHIIAAASTVTGATTASNMDVRSTSANLETLILGGTFSDVAITAGVDLTSLTFDGKALNVTISGTDLATIDIPYTNLALGSLTVTGNLDLTSLTASKVNTLKGLNISGNTKLGTVSFAALKASAASPRVAIDTNDLTIDNIQLANTTPAVAHKITSADFGPLATYIGAAVDLVVASGDSVVVTADNVTQITDGSGNVDTTVDLATAVYKSAGATSNDVLPTVIANRIFAELNGKVAGKEKFEILFNSLSSTANANVVKIGGESVSTIPERGLDTYYDVAAWASDASVRTQISNAGYTIVGSGRGKNQASLSFKNLDNDSDAVYTLSTGMGSSVSIIGYAASALSEIVKSLATALDASSNTGTASKYYSIETGDIGTTGSVITFTALARGSKKSAFNLALTAKNLSGTVASTTSMYYSTTASIVASANLADSNSAYVTFEAVTGGAAGAKTLTVTGASATQLVASGVNLGATQTGDDETYKASTETVTSSNATDVAQKSVDYTSVLVAS